MATDLITRARDFAAQAHAGQRRLSGRPYYEHPAAVAALVAEVGLDDVGVAAAYLHDVLEDTPHSPAEIEALFNAETRRLVEAVTDLKRLDYASEAEFQRANLQRMLLAMAGDVRVVVIKLADRLDNLRTLEYLPLVRQRRMARETLGLFAPLADRMGLARFRWELEDLSFRYLEPSRYRELATAVALRRSAREERLAQLRTELAAVLDAAGVVATVTGRAKNLYSIYRKMSEAARPFHDIYDLMGLRVVTATVADCYRALDAIHGYAAAVPGRYKDYIARPKVNMYQSLHTTVLWPGGDAVEIQIRTHAMDAVAEFGVAAHWRYKAGDVGPPGSRWDREPVLRLIRDVAHSPTPARAADVLRDLVKEDLFVFTPQGEVKRLPAGATPVDFAYQVHTDVGHHCYRARVNGRLVPLRTVLRNGDVVEITTSPSQEPRRDWLEFVVSSSARRRIRAFLTRRDRDELVALGREALGRELVRRGIRSRTALSWEALTSVAASRRVGSVERLLMLIGRGEITAAGVVNALLPEPAAEPTALPPAVDYTSYVAIAGTSGLEVRMAACCAPTPPTPIVGYVTSRGAVSIHRRDCNVVLRASAAARLIQAHWDYGGNRGGAAVVHFYLPDPQRVAPVVRALDGAGTRVISLTTSPQGGGDARCELTVQYANPRALKRAMATLKKAGFYDVVCERE